MTVTDQPSELRDRAGQHALAPAHVQVAGHDLTLFDESQPLREAMVPDILGAQRRVWLETYIFADDDFGRAVADALADRARAGLDVRLIYDALGCLKTPNAFFEEMRQAGVQIHAYHTLGYALRRMSVLRIFNRRDHRKLLVVDDQAAYFGGMNIVDQRGLRSVKDVKSIGLPSSAGWRDVHVRLVGPQQADVAGAFERLWRRVHRQRPYGKMPWPLRKLLASNDDAIAFFDLYPTFKYRRAQRVFVPLIQLARHDITISMAYFIPVGRLLRALLRARRRGVRIRVIVPEQSDVPAVQWATRHFYRFLLKRGIHIYERKDLMLHSKAMVIDGDWSAVGSCNLDPRSLRINLEFLGVIRSRSMANALKRICHYEMRHSRRVRLDDWHRRKWWERLRDRIAWSLRRWL